MTDRGSSCSGVMSCRMLHGDRLKTKSNRFAKLVVTWRMEVALKESQALYSPCALTVAA